LQIVSKKKPSFKEEFMYYTDKINEYDDWISKSQKKKRF